MKTLKNLCMVMGAAALVAVALSFLTPTLAQVTPTVTGTLTSVPGTVATNDVVSTNSSSVIVPNGRALAFVPEFKLTGAGTGNTIWTFQVSIDGTDWTTSAGLTHTVAAAGTTLVRSYYLLDPTELNAVRYVRLAGINNAANAAVITNIVVKWSTQAL